VALSDEGYVLANVGDSRTYLLRDDRLARLTRDDSYVQQLVDDGVITEAEARTHPRRSMVLAALDGEPGREPTLTAFAARLGDRLLLCSDGLTDFVDEGTIATVLRTGTREACADRLIELALRAGGRDNVTAVVADVVERRDPALAWG
jgi:PPM family protein phosphatase